MRIMLEMHDTINELNDNEILVYDKKSGSLKTLDVKAYVGELLAKYEIERLNLLAELKDEKDKYKNMLDKMLGLINGLTDILKGKVEK